MTITDWQALSVSGDPFSNIKEILNGYVIVPAGDALRSLTYLHDGSLILRDFQGKKEKIGIDSNKIINFFDRINLWTVQSLQLVGAFKEAVQNGRSVGQKYTFIATVSPTGEEEPLTKKATVTEESLFFPVTSKGEIDARNCYKGTFNIKTSDGSECQMRILRTITHLARKSGKIPDSEEEVDLQFIQNNYAEYAAISHAFLAWRHTVHTFNTGTDETLRLTVTFVDSSRFG